MHEARGVSCAGWGRLSSLLLGIHAAHEAKDFYLRRICIVSYSLHGMAAITPTKLCGLEAHLNKESGPALKLKPVQSFVKNKLVQSRKSKNVSDILVPCIPGSCDTKHHTNWDLKV